MPGEAEIERAQIDMVLEPADPHYGLFAPPKEAVSLADYAMALHAAALVKDGGTLQIGIGAFSDALAHALVLRHTVNAAFRELLDKLGTPLPECDGDDSHGRSHRCPQSERTSGETGFRQKR